MAYCKKAGNFLYVAVKDEADSTSNADRLGICFDNNTNNIFDGTDGELWIDRIPGGVRTSYRLIAGTYPSAIAIGTPVENPAGVTAAIHSAGSHTEYELKIDLVISPLNPSGNAFLQSIWTTDASAGITGYWPDGHVFPALQTFGRMNVVKNPAAAPVTTAGSVQGIPAMPVSVPVTVSGFTDVTAFSLNLDYEPSVISWTGFANVAGGLPGLTVSDIMVSPSVHRLVITWSFAVPVTLAPGSRLLDLVFNYISGAAALVWNTAANGGAGCEYYGPLGSPLPDYPSGGFYINGSVQAMAPVLNLANVSVGQNQSVCYNATQVINLAGGGSTFTVLGGGSAILVAGERISVFPGAKVHPGGYLDAYITTTGEYCNTGPPSMPGTAEWIPAGIQGSTQWLAKVWPNPTTGEFTLLLNPETSPGGCLVELYDMQGSRIFSDVIPGKGNPGYSIEDQPAGIYLLRVRSASQCQAARIIKLR